MYLIGVGCWCLDVSILRIHVRSLLVFSVTLLASNDTQLKSCRFVACVTRSRSHAMVFHNKGPFVCCIGGCFRKAWVDDDIGDFLCVVCDQNVLNVTKRIDVEQLDSHT